MDFCDHAGVTVYKYDGRIQVLDAGSKAGFTPEWLAEHSRDVEVQGDRILLCGTALYEVFDRHHSCPGHGGIEMMLARLITWMKSEAPEGHVPIPVDTGIHRWH